MRTALTVLLLLSFACLTLSAQDCTAAFGWDDTDLTIQFYDQSTVAPGDQIVSWEWDFGDGSTSDEQHPLHTFPSVDSYDISLTITTQNGCTGFFFFELQICILTIDYTVGACDADGNISVSLTVNDPYDEAKEIEILVDGEPIPGGPFDIDDDAPVSQTVTIPGDGLEHVIQAISADEGTCQTEIVIPTDDCSSDCFLSAMSVTTAGGTTHTVDIGDNFFAPTTTTITIGDVVRWEWVAGGHTTTSDATSGPDSWNSGERGAGAVYEFTLTNPGVHPYYCIPHGGPGGAGMAAQIVANCPGSNQFQWTVQFSTAQANPDGYDILVDGQVLPGSPFDYNGTGPQSTTLSLAGDGQSHTVTVRDIADPSCSIDRTILAPDCGAAPSCQLDVTATLAGACTAADEVPVELSINAINPGQNGFRVLVDGQPSGTFPYTSGSPTVVIVDVTGDGQSHTITVEDIADNTCSASATLTTTNCTIPCLIDNLTATTGSGTTHTVEVQDFTFAPRDITIAAGDRVEWVWTGDVAHTTTSDATSGPDGWDSGLLGNGATYLSPVLSAGVHPYYCEPHGGPGGVGMAGTITVQPDCTDGQVSVTLDFTAAGGGFNGYEVLVDDSSAGTFAYAADGNNAAAVFVPGDGQSHALTVRDVDDPACAATTSITTPDCTAPTCQLTLAAEETGGCDANENVTVTLTVGATGGGADGFAVLVDGASAGTFAYTGVTTPVSIAVAGDGQQHTFEVRDVVAPDCSASAMLTTTNCTIPCDITGLTASTGGGTTHTVEVQDFTFAPRDITIAAGDRVEWVWTGDVAHTTTSDATSGPDSWDSGLLGNGATYLSPVLSAGVHPYYCEPHGGPGGVGMAGTITVQPDCTDGEVGVTLDFTAAGGGFNGYEVLVDDSSAGTFAYAADGNNAAAVFVPGDGQSHALTVRDVDDPACAATTSITTPDCTAPTCQLTLAAEETGGCDANENVTVTLTVGATGGGADGFAVLVDGASAGTFAYTGVTTPVSIAVAGDGQQHTFEVRDVVAPDCSASAMLTTTNCTIPCDITGLTASTGGGTTHTVEVQDFTFAPRDITIAAGDRVEWVWTGDVAHTTTSDATSGPDSWDSGLLGNGATYLSPVLSAGVHPYYCEPHGGPGGVGMAGTITVQPDCTDGEVGVTLDFTAAGGGFNGYEVLVDDSSAGTFAYAADGNNAAAVFVPGDGQSHALTVRDVDDPACAATTSITTPDCNAPTCQLTLAAEETGGCDANENVTVTLTVGATGGGADGFAVLVDGASAGTFAYAGVTTPVSIAVAGDGQQHTFEVRDVVAPDCSASAMLTTTNCTIPCDITGLTATTGSGTTHTVEVQDFTFAPRDITIAAGDRVEWVWTGDVAHTTTSDATSGPDSWDSGLLGNGATYLSPVLSAGVHPYYCEPHGGPGGVGMAGTITVQPDCTDGQVGVTLSFTASGGGFNGYEVLVDGTSVGTFAYAADGNNAAAVFVPGDGQSHSLTVRDVDDPACAETTTITTPDCNAPTCQLSLAVAETGGCDANEQVTATLTVTATGGGASGFTVLVDGTSAGTFAFTGATTEVEIAVAGDGQPHTFTVQDIDAPDCTASAMLTTTNCTVPCSIDNATAEIIGTAPASIHTVEVQDFAFAPRDLTVYAGDTVFWTWTGQVPHTTTSDTTSGPDTWDSGLLGQGGSFWTVIDEPGQHPYYCTPHGAPGGIGMAGTITALPVPPACDANGEVAVRIEFIATNASPNGFLVEEDGQAITTGTYAVNGPTNVLLMLPGDGLEHTLVIRDQLDPDCVASVSVLLPECPMAGDCLLAIGGSTVGSCTADGRIPVTVDVSGAAGTSFSVFLDGELSTSGPYAVGAAGTATVDLLIPGMGQQVELVVVEAGTAECRDTIGIMLPDCGLDCALTGLTVHDGPTRHTVLVEDFQFTPRELDISVGDTVRFVWTGQVPHTATSDVLSGPNAFDSGLLGQGAEFEVVITAPGEHPYYCIPHGGPGGIGMAGLIRAALPCDADGQATLTAAFSLYGGSDSGYRVFLDGEVRYDSLAYTDPNGQNSFALSLPGDGAEHLLTIQDRAIDFCAATTIFTAPVCTEMMCAISDLTALPTPSRVHEVAVEDFAFSPRDLTIRRGDTVRFVWTGQIPHTTTSDATSGPDSWDSGLLGNGAVYDVVLTEAGVHPYYCIPHGGPGGIGMAGTITVQPECNDGNVSATLTFTATGGSPGGYEVLVDGTSAGSFAYAIAGQNSAIVPVPGDGQEHIITVQDAEAADCFATTLLTTPNCAPPTCQLALTATATTDCGSDGAVPVELTINATAPGASGFTVLVDGLATGTYGYTGDTTQLSIAVAGDGQIHTILVRDVDQSECSANATLTTADCTATCTIDNVSLYLIGNATAGSHVVDVQDFAFEPRDLTVYAGDTIYWFWSGTVPHTTTSDTTVGPDAWDSGLLGQNESFWTVIDAPGYHPYYCIPHGAPNGIGMSGSITALPTPPECDAAGNVTVRLEFTATAASPNGYLVEAGGVALATGTYAANGPTNVLLTLPGDGSEHTLTIRDQLDPSCTAIASVLVPECMTTTECDLQVQLPSVGSCTADGRIPLSIPVQGTPGSNAEFSVFVNGTLATGGPYVLAADGSALVDLLIPGMGQELEIVVAPTGQPECRDTTSVTLPDCGLDCALTALTVNAGPARHTVLVEDFQFTPRELDISVGDTVRFVWTGQVPHTATSDALTGPNAFDSGLLTQGAEYEVIITAPGEHPYYCIPHGGPGGIGMAGLIRAAQSCDATGQAIASVHFSLYGGSAAGYRVFLDGNPWIDSLAYANPQGDNSFLLMLPGDGLQHQVTVQDRASEFCAATAIFSVPDCAAGNDCSISALVAEPLGSAVHEVAVEDFEFAPRDITIRLGDTVRFVWTGQVPHTTTSDATSGPDSWDSGLLGNGAVYDVILTEPGYHPYYCIPHGGPGGIGMAGSITVVDDCEDGRRDVALRFSGPATGAGFRVLVDDTLTADSPYAYAASALQSVTVSVPADEAPHLIQVEDLERSTCRDSVWLTVPSCLAGCTGFVGDFGLAITGGDGLRVAFEDHTTGEPDTWLWGFGDGTTSTERNPIHTYAEPGTYTICLVVRNTELGCSLTVCRDEYIGSTSTAAPAATPELRVIPNPVLRDRATWRVHGLLAGTRPDLTLYGADGTVYPLTTYGWTQGDLVLGTTGLPAGFYVLRIVADGRIYAIKLLVQ